MRELVILSGKGGTGKTTVAGALAALWAGRAIFVDADVDAANLHLLTRPERLATAPFVGGKLAIVDGDRCTGCGACTARCRFGAMEDGRVRPVECEGCGLCAIVCPEGAVRLKGRTSGEWTLSRTPYGLLLHAELSPGEGNSGKLVSVLRDEGRKAAAREGVDRIVVDGPPGIGCPVMASLAGTHTMLAVAEPSVAGLHDLRRVLDLAAHFEIPCVIVVNRADVSPLFTQAVREEASRRGALVLAEIPYDPVVASCAAAGLPVTSCPESAAAGAIGRLAQGLDALLVAP